MSSPQRKEQLRQLREDGLAGARAGAPRVPPVEAFMDQAAWLAGYDSGKATLATEAALEPTDVYHIAFWTTDEDKGGYLKALKITIELDVMDNMDNMDTARIDLADHPQYKHLQSYVLGNRR